MVWSKIVLGFKFMSKNKDFGHFFEKKSSELPKNAFFDEMLILWECAPTGAGRALNLLNPSDFGIFGIVGC